MIRLIDAQSHAIEGYVHGVDAQESDILGLEVAGMRFSPFDLNFKGDVSKVCHNREDPFIW